MSAYADGHAAGCRFAREVLAEAAKDSGQILLNTTVPKIPAGKRRDHLDWLNGYAAGISHVAFPLRMQP